MKVAIYARVSTGGQVEGTSLDGQIDKCRAEAEAKGYDIVAELREEGVSGAKLDRPSMSRLLSMAVRRDIDAVLLAKVDRLARGRLVDALLEGELLKSGVKVLYVGRDTSTKEGRLLVNIEKDFAEWERETIRERLMGGKLRRAAEGKIMQSGKRAAYGYRYATQQYALHPQEAEAITSMYHWFVRERLSLREVQARLNERGILSPGGKTWHVATVHRMLSNPLYMGKWFYNRTTQTSGRKQVKPEAEWIAVPIPAIVDAELFERAQERLRQNREFSRRNSKRQYLLSGRIKCGACGRFKYSGGAFKNRGGEDVPCYQCPGRMREHNHDPQDRCRNGAYLGHKLEKLVWTSVIRALNDPSVFMAEEQSSEQDERDRHALIMLSSEQERIEREMARVLDAYKANVLTLEELSAEREVSRKKVESLARQKQELELRIAQRDQASQNRELIAVIKFLDVCSGDESSFEEKRALLEKLQVYVTVSGDDVDIKGVISTRALYSDVDTLRAIGDRSVVVLPSLAETSAGDALSGSQLCSTRFYEGAVEEGVAPYDLDGGVA